MAEMIELVEQVFGSMPDRMNSRAAAGLSAIYQFDLSGDGGGIWQVQVAGGACRVSNGEAFGRPNITISMSARDYLEMITGELNPQMAFMGGKMKIKGDMSLALKMQQVFPNIEKIEGIGRDIREEPVPDYLSRVVSRKRDDRPARALRRSRTPVEATADVGNDTSPSDVTEPRVRETAILRNPPIVACDGVAKKLTPTAQCCADALLAFLVSKGTVGPFTISVEAPWGGGKSSLMRQVERQLVTDGFSTVWFNPWKYEAGRSLWAAFALSFERQLGSKLSAPKRFRASATLALMRLTTSELTVLLLRMGLWVAVASALLWSLQVGLVNGGSDIWSVLKTSSPVVAAVAAIWAFARDASRIFANPLRVDMERFMGAARMTPPSELHRFHEDFRRALALYAAAGKGADERPKVVVFIDDLDRCEAPKAAELLQSLHLLVTFEDASESVEESPWTRLLALLRPWRARIELREPDLIFVVGMDRIKVAAAVAAKHEKLLPVLYEEGAKGQHARLNRIRFGNEFLEKFVNLTLHIPSMNGPDLEQYARQITGWTPPDSDQPKSDFLQIDFAPFAGVGSRVRDGRGGVSGEAGNESRDSEPRLQRIEAVRSEVDVSRLIKPWATTAARVLDNNPRKLKQFVNLFRLRLYLAAAADVLVLDNHAIDGKLTFHQLAKLVALELANPAAMAHVRDGQHSYQSLTRAFQGQNDCLDLVELRSGAPEFDLKAADLGLYFRWAVPTPIEGEELKPNATIPE